MDIKNNVKLEEIESILYDKSTFNQFIREKRKYSNISIDCYLKAINDYFEYQYLKENNLSKNVFETINYINNYYGYNKNYLFEEYLDNTKSTINYKFLKELLSNQKVYSNFIKKMNNLKLVKDVMIELDDLINYYRKKNIDIPYSYQKRYNDLNTIVNMKNKKFLEELHKQDPYNFIPGYIPTNELNVDFKKIILKDVDLNEDKLVIAKQIYINIAKKLEYDVDYIYAQRYGFTGKKDNLYNKNISLISEKDTSVICKGWAEIYCKILNDVGIMSKVTGGEHKFVTLKVNDMVIDADSTLGIADDEGLGINDLTRVKLGMKALGFIDENKSKNFQELMKIVDEKINYIESKHIEKRKQLIEYYNSITDQEEVKISLEEKISLIGRITETTPLKGAEYTTYVETLWQATLMKDNVKQTSIFLFTPDKYQMGKLFIVPSDPQRYFLCIKGKSCREYSKQEIERAIEKKIIFPTHKNVKIPGIREVNINERTR